MNDDFLAQMLRQAKDLQHKIAQAASKTQEQAKPYLDEALEQTRRMSETIAERVRDSSLVTEEQTQQALAKVQQALKDARPHIDSLVETARKAAGDIAASFETKPKG